ncbi:hypothetical protein Nepgr_020031 [Nepenthes gracilis]|uniref:Protein PAM68, chloroplastic n=1 Tax=Nepenthes gracilis TaxID=150966 RepID=A0AAD3SW45_NEPGR|nr:hypothetical protein Nepgr_020031 [Nepenthes gracilis]
MERCQFPRAPPSVVLSSSSNLPRYSGPGRPWYVIHTPKLHRNRTPFTRSIKISATLRNPRGFGALTKKIRKRKKLNRNEEKEEDDDNDKEEEQEEDESIIPEIVTNRMISRIAFSVGIPLLLGLLFFPFFYYLKVGLKIDVPTWVPFIVSFFFFGSALLGVSYGIVSSSWDPRREGSLLGWKEAQKNWPVFWQSLWGGSPRS